MGASRRPPSPLKSNTRVYLWMSASQPTAVLRSAVPPLVRESRVPVGPVPCAPLEGPGEVGKATGGWRVGRKQRGSGSEKNRK